MTPRYVVKEVDLASEGGGSCGKAEFNLTFVDLDTRDEIVLKMNGDYDYKIGFVSPGEIADIQDALTFDKHLSDGEIAVLVHPAERNLLDVALSDIGLKLKKRAQSIFEAVPDVDDDLKEVA